MSTILFEYHSIIIIIETINMKINNQLIGRISILFSAYSLRNIFQTSYSRRNIYTPLMSVSIILCQKAFSYYNIIFQIPYKNHEDIFL